MEKANRSRTYRTRFIWHLKYFLCLKKKRGVSFVANPFCARPEFMNTLMMLVTKG